METIRSLLNQALLIWQDSTGAGRVGIALLLALFVGGIVGVGVWSAQPNYVVLAEDLSADQASKLIDALAAKGIEYQPEGAGSIITVDKKDLALAKIEMKDLKIGKGRAEPELPGWDVDPAIQQVQLVLNLERSLEATIEMRDGVTSADVHLSIPTRSSFIGRKSTPPTASVQLGVDGQFTNQQAASIARHVATAVPALDMSDVTITDTSGRTYKTDADLMQLDEQERRIRNYEMDQVRKAYQVLQPMYGYENCVVNVSAEFSFPNEQIKTHTIDGDSKVVVSEDTTNTTVVSGGKGAAEGTAGVINNTQPRSLSSSDPQSVEEKTETNNFKYDFDTEDRVAENRDPILESLSVSVLVNQAKVADQDGNPLTGKDLTDKLASLEKLISNSVGLGRLDEDKASIVVEAMEFAVPEAVEAPAVSTIPWDQINEILKNVSLGIAALVALFVSFRALRKFQPETPTNLETAGAVSSIGELSEMVKENPEIFSKIIASWSAEPDEEMDDAPAVKAA